MQMDSELFVMENTSETSSCWYVASMLHGIFGNEWKCVQFCGFSTQGFETHSPNKWPAVRRVKLLISRYFGWLRGLATVLICSYPLKWHYLDLVG
jgi:hypothetical protein